MALVDPSSEKIEAIIYRIWILFPPLKNLENRYREKRLNSHCQEFKPMLEKGAENKNKNTTTVANPC